MKKESDKMEPTKKTLESMHNFIFNALIKAHGIEGAKIIINKCKAK